MAATKKTGIDSKMEQEFAAIFDLLDPKFRGFIDEDQIQEFHVAFYFAPVPWDQIKASVDQVCGQDAGGKCSRKLFLPLLFELERRKTAEENAWWDFKALDTRDCDRISIKEALMLFKATHQEHFTMLTWQKFMEARKFSNRDVTFDEIRMWLCDPPLPGDECENQEVVDVCEQLERDKRKADYQEHKEFITLQNDEFIQAIEAREKQQYRDKFQRGAKRKLNRWVNLGVEALIFDDGLDFDDVERMARNRVTVQDLLEALDEKYDILREKLLWEAVKTHIGQPLWSSMSESEQEEQVLRVQMKEQQFRKQDQLDQITQMTISYQQYESRLVAMMGYIRFQHLNDVEEMQNKASMLKADGKTDDEIFALFAQEYAEKVEGASNVGHLLVDLHKRHMEEREFLLAALKGAESKALTSIEMITEYVLIASQQVTVNIEELQFEYCAMATGLAERPQEFKSESFDSDRDKQELVALERLYQRKGKKPSKDEAKDRMPIRKSTGLVDWQVEVIRQVLKKHAYERQFLTYLLQGKESVTSRASARHKTADMREERQKELRSQCSNWRQSTAEYRTSKRTIFIKILLEAVAIYHETRRQDIKGGHNLDDNQISACVLADVQQKQAQEIESILMEMQYKVVTELAEIWRREHRARTEEWLENITKVCLGMYQLSEEERQIVQALEEKYECLRDKLLAEALMNEIGKKEWAELSEEERQRRLMQKKLEERRCRQEGRMDQLGRILGQAFKDQKKLQALMGKSREEYEKYLEERLQRRERRRAEGLDTDDESDSETTDDSKPGSNLLKDLQYRYDDELEAIMALLQKQRDRELSERERQELLLRLRLERRRAERENNFDQAAMLMGLAERNRLSLEERLKADRERQMRLARERIANRKRRKENGEEDPIEPEEQALPEQGDLLGWKDNIMKELERKHAAERELQLVILMDEGSEDLREAAKEMTQEARQRRLQDLKGSAEGLNLDKEESQETNRDVLEEAGAIKCVLRKLTLEERNEGRDISTDEMIASLLADLQQEQDKEVEIVLMSLAYKTEEQLSKLHRQQIWERQQKKCRNILIVFTMYEGVGSEDELVKALEKKYDTLRDKLLLEALKKQLGAAEWAMLSEQERQKRLLALKREERRLRKEGKLDELALLLGDFVKTETQLKKLMGDNKADYEEKLRKRLEARRKRIAEGLDPEDEGISEDEDSEEDQNTFTELNKRFEEERDALMARLRSSEDQYLSEKERQAELARLKREQRKAKMEDDFMAAALVLGLAERHQAAAEERLKNDRARQEQLAKQRIEAMKKRKKNKLSTITEEDEKIVENGDRAVMQDAVIKSLEKKHAQERETLLELLQSELTEDDALIVENMTSEQRQEKLQEIWARRRAAQFKTQEEHIGLLQEAASVKAPGRKKRLERETKKSVSFDDVIVSIMADLQQQQDKESELVMQQLPERDLATLAKLQQQNVMEKKFGKNENVAIVVTTPDVSTKGDDDELVEALENKFDALRDKVLAEALMKQMGEADWAKLSEKERQARLIKLKLRERKLRQEGKYDEVAALLGDAVKSQQALELLLGDTKKAQEEKMRERLARRKERLAQGMTEEEVQKLEEEEIQQEEEELKKKKPKNILEELDHRLDAEKEALLAGLKGQEDHLANEKARQAELARLRREQRKARKEEKFDAAALAMGLVQDAQKSQEAIQKDRKRQEQLAKERLEQRKKAARAAKEARRRGESGAEGSLLQTPTIMSVVPMPENENDKIAMQEVVIKELEMKHTEERNLLIGLFAEEEDSDRRAQAKAMSEDTRQKRLAELKDTRQQWRESGKTMANEEEQILIFHKAAPIQLESKMSDLKENKPEDEVKDEDAEVTLLADLQQQQDQESANLLKDLSSKSAVTLKQIKQVQFIARLHGWNDNVAHAVLQVKGQGDEVTEEQLVKALENKYDALKDKLLAESLMSQMGAAEWAALSEKERQARLMKLKLQERKLRAEGRFDEATALITEGIKNQEELARLLGDTKAQQEERMKKRLERLKQLKAEREAEGLTVDDETLEEMVDKEDSRKDALETRRGRKKNILEDLNSHFEDEKDALLASLRNQDARLQSEKQRQLALAKMKREKRKLQEEDTLDTAAMIFGMAQTNEATRQANLLKEKERQKKLARERVLAQRQKRAQRAQNKESPNAGDDDDEEDVIGSDDFMSKKFILRRLKKEEEDNVNCDAMEATKAMQGEGQIALHNSILDEIEKKHASERDILVNIMEVIQIDKNEMEKVTQLNDKALADELESLKEDRDSWKRGLDQEFAPINAEQLSPEQLDYHLTRVADREETQRSILKRAILLRMEDIRRNLVAQGKLSGQELEDEVSVSLLAELQGKQSAENSALSSILTADQAEEVLIQLKTAQRRHRREHWLENLVHTVFTASAMTMGEELSGEDQAMLKDQEDQMKEMEAQMEKEKEELLNKEKSILKSILKKDKPGFDAEAMLKQLEAQHERKKKAMQDQLMRQKRLAMQKLEKRRQKRQDKDYEEMAAVALLQNAEKNEEMREENKQAQKEKQSNLMKDRLAARREARKKAEEEKIAEAKKKEEEERKKKDEEERRQRGVSFREREDTLDYEEDKFGERDPSSVPSSAASSRRGPFGLQREKTVIDVDVSEEKKKELFEKLMQDHGRAQLRIEAEKEERQKMLKLRLMERKNRNQNAATMILGLGERQKTIVERTKKEERERQISSIKERIERVRYERTQTMKLKSDQNTKDFKSLTGSGRTTPQDEAMAKQAAKLQEKFAKEQLEYKSGAKSVFTFDDDQVSVASPVPPQDDDVNIKVTKLTDADRKRLMKEKMKKKKERQATSVAAASDMDALAQMIDDKKKHAGDEVGDEAI